ncbi:MAG: methylated-DNA--[protein]-cysteine S-methyltransferase [Clostridiaceae bacterium]|nr:methylated-DNA--[protein]-cysteine S-methyltransferase [Clostridiaceae bacterium]
MEAADHFDTDMKHSLKLRLEPLRKMDINDLKTQAGSAVAGNWLDRIKNARAGVDPVFDGAWKAVTVRGIEAIVWITGDSFDRYNYCVRVVPFLQTYPDIDFWLELISTVHNSQQDAVSISWLLGSEQNIGQEALTRWNYRFVACLRAQMADPTGACRHDAWLYRTDALLRPDLGISFVGFKFGWLAVSGSCRGIRKIEFVRTGSQIADIIVSMHAKFLGLLDDQGSVLSPDKVGRIVAKDAGWQVPLPVSKAADQLEEYLTGNRKEFDLELEREHYSDFQRRVWEEISNVPYGVTATYEDLAIKLASPGQKPYSLARAVGTACASNPLPLVVPCHRIIGKDGRLTGFNGGVDIKEYLLNHEMFGLV